jgi:uncharacterized membrane protein YcaP (DUF421 family)
MDIVLRAVVMYFLILLMLRVTTRKMMRSATPLELTVVFLFGGLGVQPLLGGDRSLTAAFLGVITIASLHISLSSLELLVPVLGRVTKGAPVIVYRRGEWDWREMQMLRIQPADVLAEMRLQGLRNLDQVETVVVEHNGGITIIRAEQS